MRTIGLRLNEPVQAAPAPQKAVSDMKKAELVAYAEEHGIEIDAKATVAVVREAIEAAESPVEAPVEATEDEPAPE